MTADEDAIRRGERDEERERTCQDGMSAERRAKCTPLPCDDHDDERDHAEAEVVIALILITSPVGEIGID